MNNHNLAHEIRKIFEKISNGFKETDFFEDELSSDEIQNVKNFGDERTTLNILLKTATLALDIPRDVWISQPTQTLQDFHSLLQNIFESLQKFRTFHQSDEFSGRNRPQSSDAIQSAKQKLSNKKENLTTEFQKFYSDFPQKLYPLISWGVHTQLNARMNQAQIESAIAPHAKQFKENAASHRAASFIWLWATVGMLVCTLIYSHCVIYAEIQKTITTLLNAGDAAKNAKNLYWGLIGVRLVAFSLLGSVVFWGFQNYKLNKHNELLNMVKAASLDSFKDFCDTTQNWERTQNLVIQKIADTIFDAERFGYIAKSETPANINPSQLVDMLLSSKKDT
jgi:curved DNA-binding protein CbpA